MKDVPPIRPSQVEGVKALLGEKRLILGDGVGFGKTRQVLEAYKKLRKYGPMLVTAPHEQAIRHWIKEIGLYAPKLRVEHLSGAPKTRKLIYRYWMNDGLPDIVLATHDLCRVDFETLKNIPWYVVTVDEAHKVKNHRAKTRSRRDEDGIVHPGRRSTRDAIAKIMSSEDVPYRWLLTATPLRNRVQDLWSNLNMLGPKRPEDAHLSSYWKWVAYYMPIFMSYGSGRQYREIGPVYKNKRKEFRRMLRRYLLMRKRSDRPGEFPVAVIETVVLPMLPKHRTAYDELLKKMRIEVGNDKRLVAKNVLHHRIMLRLAAISPHLCDPSSEEIEGAKLDWTEDLMLRGERIVVASESKEALLRWSKRLTRKGISHGVLSGDDTPAKRHKVWEAFHRGDVLHLLVSASAARESIDLSATKILVLLDRSWVADDNTQMVGRVVRPPNTGGILVYLLESEDSIDQYVASVNMRKDKLVARTIPVQPEDYIYGTNVSVRTR